MIFVPCPYWFDETHPPTKASSATTSMPASGPASSNNRLWVPKKKKNDNYRLVIWRPVKSSNTSSANQHQKQRKSVSHTYCFFQRPVTPECNRRHTNAPLTLTSKNALSRESTLLFDVVSFDSHHFVEPRTLWLCILSRLPLSLRLTFLADHVKTHSCWVLLHLNRVNLSLSAPESAYRKHILDRHTNGTLPIQSRRGGGLDPSYIWQSNVYMSTKSRVCMY